jgi:hypothetical protein
VPTIAGDYTVNVKLLEEDILGSPYELVVIPGEIGSLNSYTTVTDEEIEAIVAGTTYLFTI